MTELNFNLYNSIEEFDASLYLALANEFTLSADTCKHMHINSTLSFDDICNSLASDANVQKLDYADGQYIHDFVDMLLNLPFINLFVEDVETINHDPILFYTVDSHGNKIYDFNEVQFHDLAIQFKSIGAFLQVFTSNLA